MILSLPATAAHATSATDPTTAAGTTETPCPGCTGDADGDGVVDARDQCPNTEDGAPVTVRGCPHDSDGDGLYDHRDRCATTPPSGRVDARGCEIGDEIPLPEVVFGRNESALDRRATRALDELVDTLELHPELRIEIAGYTDSRGSEDGNLRLSARRAEAVRRYLLTAGIAAGRVGARGYGEADPIADNDTDWGRARNRRVVVRVLNP